MADEPEEGFTVRDRRRFMGDAPVETAAPPAAPVPAEPIAAEEHADLDFLPGEEDDAALPDVYSVLALFLGELRNLAWLRMGLVANPATGAFERDLPQARIAIDTVAFLAGQLDGVVAPEERLPLKALVSDLQVNFVEQSKRGE
jgi:hypothetical protein